MGFEAKVWWAWPAPLLLLLLLSCALATATSAGASEPLRFVISEDSVSVLPIGGEKEGSAAIALSSGRTELFGPVAGVGAHIDFAFVHHEQKRLRYISSSGTQGRDHVSIEGLRGAASITFKPISDGLGHLVSGGQAFLEMEGVGIVEMPALDLERFIYDMSDLEVRNDTLYLEATHHEASGKDLISLRSGRAAFPRFFLDCSSLRDFSLIGGAFDGTVIVTGFPRSFGGRWSLSAPGAALVLGENSAQERDMAMQEGYPLARNVFLPCDMVLAPSSLEISMAVTCTGLEFIDITSSSFININAPVETDAGSIHMETLSGTLSVLASVSTVTGDLSLVGSSLTGDGLRISAPITTGGANVFMEGTTAGPTFAGVIANSVITVNGGSGTFEMQGMGVVCGIELQSAAVITITGYNIDWEGTASGNPSETIAGLTLSGPTLSFFGGSNLSIVGSTSGVGISPEFTNGISLIAPTIISSEQPLSIEGDALGSFGSGFRLEDDLTLTGGQIDVTGTSLDGFGMVLATETVVDIDAVAEFEGMTAFNAVGAALSVSCDFNVLSGSSLTLRGGDASGAFTAGVFFEGSINSNGGDVTIEGTAGFAGSNPTSGVFLTTDAFLSGTGAEVFTITGTGGVSPVDFQSGVVLQGVCIDAVLYVVGTGGGSTSSDCYGVEVRDFAVNSNISIDGTGSTSSGARNYGVLLGSAFSLSSSLSGSSFDIFIDITGHSATTLGLIEGSLFFPNDIVNIHIMASAASPSATGSLTFLSSVDTLGTLELNSISSSLPATAIEIGPTSNVVAAATTVISGTSAAGTGVAVSTVTFAVPTGASSSTVSITGEGFSVGVLTSNDLTFGDAVEVTISGTGTGANAMGAIYASNTPDRASGSFTLSGTATSLSGTSTGLTYSGLTDWRGGDVALSGSSPTGTGIVLLGALPLTTSAPGALLSIFGSGLDMGIALQGNVDTLDRNVVIFATILGGVAGPCVSAQLSSAELVFAGTGSRSFESLANACSSNTKAIVMGPVLRSDAALTMRGDVAGAQVGDEGVAFDLSSHELYGGSTFLDELEIISTTDGGAGLVLGADMTYGGFVKLTGMSSPSVGVSFLPSSQHFITSNGQLTVVGNAGGSGNAGVILDGDFQFTSASNMAVSGAGSSNGAVGVLVNSDSVFDCDGICDPLAVDGTGGISGDDSHGVVFSGTFTNLRAIVNGQGGGDSGSSSCFGVLLADDLRFSDESLIITGTGGLGMALNHGVVITSLGFTGTASSVAITGAAGFGGNSVNAQGFLANIDDFSVTTSVAQSSEGGIVFEPAFFTSSKLTIDGKSFNGVGVSLGGVYDVSSSFIVTGTSMATGSNSKGVRVSIQSLSSTAVLDVTGSGEAMGVEGHSALTLAAGSSATFTGDVPSSSEFAPVGVRWAFPGGLVADGVSQLVIDGTVMSSSSSAVGVHITAANMAIEDLQSLSISGSSSEGTGLLIDRQISLSLNILSSMTSCSFSGFGFTGVSITQPMLLPDFVTGGIAGNSQNGADCVAIDLSNAVVTLGSGNFVITALSSCFDNIAIDISNARIVSAGSVTLMGSSTIGNGIHSSGGTTTLTATNGMDITGATQETEGIFLSSAVVLSGEMNFMGSANGDDGIGIAIAGGSIALSDETHLVGTAAGESAGVSLSDCSIVIADTALTIDGTGGPGGDTSVGVRMSGLNVGVSGSGDALLDITGAGGANGGVGVQLFASVLGVTLNVDGTGTGIEAAPGRFGVDILDVTTDRPIVIDGQGGNGLLNGLSAGIHLGSSQSIISSSDVTLSASAHPSQTTGVALHFEAGTIDLSSGSGQLLISNAVGEKINGILFDGTMISTQNLLQIDGYGAFDFGVRFEGCSVELQSGSYVISGTGGTTGISMSGSNNSFDGAGSFAGNGQTRGIDSLSTVLDIIATGAVQFTGTVDSGMVIGAKGLALGTLEFSGSGDVELTGTVTTAADFGVGVSLNFVSLGNQDLTVNGVTSSSMGIGVNLGSSLESISSVLSIVGRNTRSVAPNGGIGVQTGDITLDGFLTIDVNGECNIEPCQGIFFNGRFDVSDGTATFDGTAPGSSFGILALSVVQSTGTGDLIFRAPASRIGISGPWTQALKAGGTIQFEDRVVVSATVTFSTGPYDMSFAGFTVTPGSSLTLDGVANLNLNDGAYIVLDSAAASLDASGTISSSFSNFASDGTTEFVGTFAPSASANFGGSAGGQVSFGRISGGSAGLVLGGSVDYEVSDSMLLQTLVVSGASFVMRGGNVVILSGAQFQVPFDCRLPSASTVDFSGASFSFAGTEEAGVACSLDIQGSNSVVFNAGDYNHSGATLVRETMKKKDSLASLTDEANISGVWRNSPISIGGSITAYIADGAELRQGLTLVSNACLEVGSTVGDTAIVFIATLDLLGSGTVIFDINGPSAHDSIAVGGSGAVNLGTTTQVSFINDGSSLSSLSSFPLITGQASITGAFSNFAQSASVSLGSALFQMTYSFGASGQDVFLAGGLEGTDDSFAVTGSTSVAAPGVLQNDAAYLNNPSVVAVPGPSPVSFGTLTLLSDGSFTYDSEGQSGEATFTYIIQFDVQTSAPVNVTLTVDQSTSPTASPTASPPASPTPSMAVSLSSTPTSTVSVTPSVSAPASSSPTQSSPPSILSTPSNSPTRSGSRTPTRSSIRGSATASPSPSSLPSASSSAFLLAPSRSRTPTLALFITNELPPVPASPSPAPTPLPSPSVSSSQSTICPPGGCDGFLAGFDVQPAETTLGGDASTYRPEEDVYRVLIFDDVSNVIGSIDVPASQVGSSLFVYGPTDEVTFIDEISSSIVDITLSGSDGRSVNTFERALEICLACVGCSQAANYCLGFYDTTEEKWLCQDNSLVDATDGLQSGSSGPESALASDDRLRFYCGSSDHLTNFALLLDAQGGGGDDDDDGGYIYAYLSAGFIGAAIVIVVLAALVIEVIIRRDTTETNSRLSLANKQSTTSIGSSSEYSEAPEIPAFKEPVWDEEEDA